MLKNNSQSKDCETFLWFSINLLGFLLDFLTNRGGKQINISSVNQYIYCHVCMVTQGNHPGKRGEANSGS